MKRLSAAACAAGLAKLPLAQAATANAPASKRPNVVVVMADDHRWDLMSCRGHKFLKTPNFDKLAQEGCLFENAFVTTATCTPSRASFLTGKMPHQASVPRIMHNLSFEMTQTTYPGRLRAAGYHSAYIGKFHIGEKHGHKDFDYFVTDEGGGRSWQDPVMYINGAKKQIQGFHDKVVADLAAEHIQKRAQQDQPFFLQVAFKCPHIPFTYPEDMEGLFKDDDIPKPETYDETPAESGRHPIMGRTRLRVDANGPARVARWGGWDGYIKAHYRSAQSLDRHFAIVRKALEDAGILDDTILVYTSDHGFSLGDHGLTSKHFAYREPMRIPMIVRWPAAVPASIRPTEMAQSIDLSATVLDLCGIERPDDMIGKSWRPVFEAKGQPLKEWREDILFVFESVDGNIPGQIAVRTPTHKLVKYIDFNFYELYDLVKDPLETKNVAKDPAYAEILAALQTRLEQWIEDTEWAPRDRHYVRHAWLAGCWPRDKAQEIAAALKEDPGFDPEKAFLGMEWERIDASGNNIPVAPYLQQGQVALMAVPLERDTSFDPAVSLHAGVRNNPRMVMLHRGTPIAASHESCALGSTVRGGWNFPMPDKKECMVLMLEPGAKDSTNMFFLAPNGKFRIL